MSYILEALKKVEQKQQREGIPRLLTLPPDVPEEGKKSRVLLYVIIGALLLNAVVMTAWWIAPWRHRETITPVTEPLAVPEKTLSGTTERTSAPAPVVPAPDRSSFGPTTSVISDKSAPLAKPAGAIGTEVGPGQRERTAASTAKSPPETQPRKEAVHASPAFAPRSRLFDLGELPPTIRGSLPEFKISGHAYSPEPRFRVARVNNKIVQEGEALSQGLKVDEIVPGGVIFTYQGYRFRVGVNDNL